MADVINHILSDPENVLRVIYMHGFNGGISVGLILLVSVIVGQSILDYLKAKRKQREEQDNEK